MPTRTIKYQVANAYLCGGCSKSSPTNEWLEVPNTGGMLSICPYCGVAQDVSVINLMPPRPLPKAPPAKPSRPKATTTRSTTKK